MAGPLDGVTMVEVGGIGPGPFAGMILADLGARVIRVDRPGGSAPLPIPADKDLCQRGKLQVALDLKQPAAVEALLALIDSADLLIEGYRPGVAERLGFGPDVCHERNPALVYGRMTGWGQDGPRAVRAGHDVNYVSLTGALHAIGEAGRPPAIPLNLIGDYGGGSTYLVIGLLAGLLHARQSGQGQVVDAAIVDGTSHLLASTLTLLNSGFWTDRRGSNLLDGAAPFYGVYETSDERHMAVGPIEEPFWDELLSTLGISDTPDRLDPQGWPRLRLLIAQVFRTRTQAEWTEVFAGSDACVTPVVSLAEAPDDPHISARGSLTTTEDGVIPAPAPRFSVTPPPEPRRPAEVGSATRHVLESVGIDADSLIESGAAHQS